MSELRLHFDHGLGDCVHFAHLLQLYKRAGYDRITISGDKNKRPIWKNAGITWSPTKQQKTVRWLYPNSFEELKTADHIGNKIAHGINNEPLPPIGKKSSLWFDLCSVRLEFDLSTSNAAIANVEAFLDGLNRPIVALHTNGSNWAERKNFPAQLAVDFIRTFAGEKCGSIVVLDWDQRAPLIDHSQVKPIRSHMGMIDLYTLAALYSMSDLMVGVDSGPFHFCNMMDIPAVGVFFNLHPVRVCLPNPNARYVVSDRYAEHWKSRRPLWDLVEYRGKHLTSERLMDIVHGTLTGQSHIELATAEEIKRFSGLYDYHRVGHDRRHIELLQDGTIRLGTGDQERRWRLDRVDDALTLNILGDAGITCALVCDDSGVWRGRYNRWEKMPVELTPIKSVRDRIDLSEREDLEDFEGFWIRKAYRSQDATVIKEVYVNDCYWTGIRPSAGEGEIVVDIGAHIGSFALKWHRKNPMAKIICVEACPENIEVLRSNVGHFATVVQAACTYETDVVLHNSVMENGWATGGSIVAGQDKSIKEGLYWRDERPLRTVTLEQIMRELVIDKIDVLKLDCEGSEFSILEKTTSLDKVKFICGEYHGIKRWDEFRAERFSPAAWNYGHMHSAGGLGIFHYARK